MTYRWLLKSQNLLIASLALLLILAVACGGSATATSPPQATTAAATTAPPTATSPDAAPGATLELFLPTPTPTTAPPPAKVVKGGGTINLQSFAFPPQTWTPHVYYPVFLWAGPIHNLLIEYDPTTPDPFDIRGDLAKSWELSEDGLTYTFRLHEGVKFHDGTPVTADDAVYSVDRMATERGFSRDVLLTYYEPGNARAIDQHTLAVDTKFPTVDILAVFAMEASQIISQEWQEAVEAELEEGDPQPWEKLMGSGPFKQGKQVRDVSVDLVKNEDYFKDGFPLLDGLHHIVVIEKGTIIAAYKTGQVLLSSYPITRLTTRDALTLDKETPNVTAHFTPPNNMFPLLIQSRRAPWDDPRVRQALNLAIHRQPIRDTLGIAGVGAVGPPLLGSRAGWSWGRTDEEISQLPGYRELDGEKHPDDIKAAQDLMAEAGLYPGGFTVTTYTDASRAGFFAILTDQLKEFLNITLDVKTVDSATAARLRDERAVDVWVDTTPPRILSPDSWLFQAYMPTVVALKDTGWEAPQWFLDKVWEQAEELDQEKRIAMIRELEDHLIHEDPGSQIIIFFEARHILVNDKVKNFNMTALSITQLKQEHIWCDPSC